MKVYPKYKPSGVDWLDKIPEQWNDYKIKFAININKSTLTDSTPDDFEFNYIDIESVNGSSIEKTQKLTFTDAPSRARRIVQSGDIILSTVRTYLKAIAKVPDIEGNIVASTGFAVFSSSKIVILDYLKYLAVNDYFIQAIVGRSKGANYPAIAPSELVTIKTPIPSLSEQQQIADFLDYKTEQCDRFISNRQKQIELLNEQKAAIINKAVTKGINPNAKMKPSGIDWIGDIPEHWRTSRLKMFSKIYSGGTPDTKEKEYWENGTVPWIASGEVNQELITTPTTFITEEALKNSSAKWIPKNAIVMALAGQGKTKGTVSLTGIEVTGNQSLAAIVPKNINSKYLYYWLKSKYQDIRGLVGEDRDGLNLDLIGSIVIPIPSLSEQEKTTIYIEKEFNILDNLISKYQKQIELMQEYHTALISQAVTGKIDVRDWKPPTK